MSSLKVQVLFSTGAYFTVSFKSPLIIDSGYALTHSLKIVRLSQMAVGRTT